MRLEGKIALVTGASSGIGAAIARDLSAEGVILLLVGRNRARLEATAADCVGDPCVLALDLTESTAASIVAAEAQHHFGRIDALVNNAGIAESASFENTDTSLLRRHLRTNAEAPFELTRACLPMLRNAAKQGSRPTVVNIASVVAHRGYPGQAAYSASKHALLGWTKAAAAELADEGIRFHAVSPGGVATPMARGVRPDLDPSNLIAPVDVAAAVLFLLKSGVNAAIDEIQIRRDGSPPFV